MDTKHHITLAEVTPVFPPYRSGMGTVADENARMAGEAGIETTVFTPRYPRLGSVKYRESRNGFTVIRSRPIAWHGNAAVLPQLLWRLVHARLIHFHYPALGMELPIVLLSLLGKKLIVTYHFDLVGKGRLMRAIFSLYSKLFLPIIIARASKVFVTSFDYAYHSRLLSSFFNTRRELFVELPCSVDTSVFRSLSAENARLSPRPYFLFVGALDAAHYSKGVPVLLSAFANAKAVGVDLVIVGDGDLRPQYEQHARALGISEHVVFRGSVSRDELVRWYAGALCLVLPSTDTTEAFGIAIIEAAASGVPALSTRLPGVQSVIEEGITGLLVEPNNVTELAEKILTIATHHELARTMGVAARKRVEEGYAYSRVKELFLHHVRPYLS